MLLKNWRLLNKFHSLIKLQLFCGKFQLMKHILILLLFLGTTVSAGNQFGGEYPTYDLLKATDFNIEIRKNSLFQNSELDALYTITCTNIKTKSTRLFKIIKTNKKLKNYFLADYIIIETEANQSRYYPIGWENNKIKESDIKTDCLSILEGQVKPVDEKEF